MHKGGQKKNKQDVIFIRICLACLFIFNFSHQQGSAVDQQIFVVVHCRKISEFIGDLNTVIGDKSGDLSLSMFALCLLNVNYSFFHFSLSIKIKHLDFFWGMKSYSDWERREFMPHTVCILPISWSQSWSAWKSQSCYCSFFSSRSSSLPFFCLTGLGQWQGKDTVVLYFFPSSLCFGGFLNCNRTIAPCEQC